MGSDAHVNELVAQVEGLEAEARQREEDHLTQVMELTGRMRDFVQRLDVSEADAKRLRARLAERERQLENRNSRDVHMLQHPVDASAEELNERLILLETLSAEQDLAHRTCEEEHAAREAELTGHIRDLAKRTDYAESELEKVRNQYEAERTNHINFQVEQESLVKSLKDQVDVLSQANFRLNIELGRCMDELRKVAAERPFLWDRRLVTQGLCVYLEQRDRSTRAEVLARLADTLEFTLEERERLGVTRKLSRVEQDLADAAQASRRRHVFSDLANQFVRFVSAEIDGPPISEVCDLAPHDLPDRTSDRENK